MGWIHSWTLNIASTLLQDLSTLVSYVLFLGCSLAGQHQQQVLSCRKEIAFCICCRVFQNLRIFCGSGAQVGHGCYRLSSIPRYGFELGATVGGVSWRWRSAYRRLRLSGALNVVKHGWPGSAPQPCVRKKGCKFGSHLERHVKCGGCMQWQDGHIMKHMNRCHPLCHFSFANLQWPSLEHIQIVLGVEVLLCLNVLSNALEASLFLVSSGHVQILMLMIEVWGDTFPCSSRTAGATTIHSGPSYGEKFKTHRRCLNPHWESCTYCSMSNMSGFGYLDSRWGARTPSEPVPS